jgi:hypothetical protein
MTDRARLNLGRYRLADRVLALFRSTPTVAPASPAGHVYAHRGTRSCPFVAIAAARSPQW